MAKNILYITAANKEEALLICNALVTEKLVACANIFPEITSVYWWEGEVQNDSEVAIIAKTTEQLVKKAEEKVKSLHSYDCPCIVSWPISDGNADFLKWIGEVTK